LAGFGVLEQSETLFAAMSVQPNSSRQDLYNTAIDGLVTAGIWDKGRLIYGCAAHDEQAGRLNWKTPGSNTLTAVNSPTFTTDRGFKGDDVSAHLDSGTTLGSLAGISTTNLSMYAYINDHDTPTTQVADPSIGIHNIVAATILPYQFTSPDRATYWLGGTVDQTICELNTATQLGARSFSVDGSENIPTGYQDGQALTPSQVADWSSLPTGTVVLLRTSSLYSSGRVAFAWVGETLTEAEHGQLNAIALAYLTGMGAQ
jgi:hypothetical protein